MLSRTVLKVYEFLGNIVSLTLLLYILFAWINKYINNFELKKRLVFGLFKNFEINTKMMSQLKIIQEKYNEVEYKNNPDFVERNILFYCLENDNRQTLNSERNTLEKKNNMNFITNKQAKRLRHKGSPFIEKEFKLKEIELKKSEENQRFNNDPIIFESLSKDIDMDKCLNEYITEIKKTVFTYSLSDICCKFWKIRSSQHKLEYENRKKFFYDAYSILEYYTDSITYFKKMLEIEIIKYYLFSKEERRLISIISNPDFINLDKNHIYKKINMEYEQDRFYLSHLDELLNKILKDGRNNSNNNKLLQLVQLGNHKLFNSDEI